MAQIIMVFGKLEIPYGTYRFSTDAEKNRVNELARDICKVLEKTFDKPEQNRKETV